MEKTISYLTYRYITAQTHTATHFLRIINLNISLKAATILLNTVQYFISPNVIKQTSKTETKMV